jgi:hypothetical protein
MSFVGALDSNDRLMALHVVLRGCQAGDGEQIPGGFGVATPNLLGGRG